MPTLTPEEVEARKYFLGGSDAGSLINAAPYGCARQLAAKKLGLERDAVEVHNPLFDRGHALEPVFADEYGKRTGCKIQIITDHDAVGNAKGKALRKGRPWFRLNIDRRALRPEGPRLLEIKSAGENAFKKYQKEGPPLYMLAQVQWALGYTGWDDSDLSIGWADGWEFLDLKVERDEETIGYLLAKGEEFMFLLEEARALLNATGDTNAVWDMLPPELPEGSSQCDGCDWGRGCKGPGYERAVEESKNANVMDLSGDPEFVKAAEDWLAAYPLYKEGEAAVAGAKNRMKDRMKAVGATQAKCPGIKISWNPGIRKAFDQTAHAAGSPECHDKYTATTPTRTMRPTKTKR